jgi:hypothetical protein
VNLQLALEAAAILVSMTGATIGFSLKGYLFLRTLTDESFARAYVGFADLYAKKIVSDPDVVRDLMKYERGYLAEYDTSDLSEYGMMRRWKETVRLEFKPGTIDQRKNFVGINPIHGFNQEGQECFAADHSTWDQTFVRRLTGEQQRLAFQLLLVGFILQLLTLISGI